MHHYSKNIFNKFSMHTFIRSNKCLYLTAEHIMAEQKTATWSRQFSQSCSIIMWPSQDVREKLHTQFENFWTAFVHAFDRVFFNEESKNNYLTVLMAVALFAGLIG